jgi:glutathione S-transferase
MFIAEKGLDIETRQVDLGRGEQLSPEFLAVNPLATVPVLVTDSGVNLSENVAIATYLEAEYPEPALMGRTSEERALVVMWNTIIDQQCALPVADVLRNSHPKMAGRALPGPENFDQIPELAARGKARIEAFYGRLDAHLQGRQFLAINDFSLADISAFIITEFAAQVGMPIPPENSATVEWHAGVAERPSASV